MSGSKRNLIVAGAVGVFAIGMGSVPLFFVRSMQQQGKNLHTTENASPGQVYVRGAYVNTGSKDAGPDPDWDAKTHSWKGRKTIKDSSSGWNVPKKKADNIEDTEQS